MRNTGYQLKARDRKTFNVPAVAGNYCNERITLGPTPSGLIAETFIGVTAQVESAVANAVVELWLPQVPDATLAADQRTEFNYFFSGQSIPAQNTTNSGVASNALTSGQGIEATWSLAAYPGGQIRVRSGGSAGAMPVSATAW